MICQTCGLDYSMDPPQRIKLENGIYRHYKGELYQTLLLAHDADYEGRNCVVYMGLELNGSHLGFRGAVRSLAPFNGWLSVGDNEHVKRFTYLGPELTAEMLP
jgi:hypothetical protein